MGNVRLVFGFCLLMLCGRCLAAEKPNILFLLSDDHSYPYLGCYGNKDVRTPNLDRLAAQGMRFDRMFVGCPQCVPSRASLMTGRSPVAIPFCAERMPKCTRDSCDARIQDDPLG